MFGLESLDVLIGLITLYLVFGLACTAVVEALAAWASVRSKTLETGLREMLAGKLGDGRDLLQSFHDHPLMQSLSKCSDGRPSYIPPDVVSKVIYALITANGALSVAQALEKLPDSVDGQANRIKGLLQALLPRDDAGDVLFKKEIEAHFDKVMDRASGWFKRHQQNVALVVSLVLVGAANLDTFALANALSSSPEVRAKLIAVAEQQAAAGPPPSAAAAHLTPAEAAAKAERAAASVRHARETVNAAGLGFGWDGWPRPEDMIAKLLGLLISAFAISLGAPFWFDVLRRFMQVRQAGISPREKKPA